MTWVNLDDVYVSTSGGTITGDLNIKGGLTITTNNASMDVYDEILTLRDSVSPTLLYLNNSSTPLKEPLGITINYNVNNFNRLVVFGSTYEWRRCSVELIKSHSQSTFNAMYFTLFAYNGDQASAYLKMTDYKINISGSTTTILPKAYNEVSVEGASCIAKTGIGVDITAVYGYTDMIYHPSNV